MPKYRKRDDWEAVGQKVATRKRERKDSGIYINNKVISKGKFQKQIRHRTFTTIFEQNVPGASVLWTNITQLTVPSQRPVREIPMTSRLVPP